jgi:thioredoxin-dependent peroxiredoxin
METIELKEGTKAPDFSLIGSDRKEHSLIDYLGKKVILYFYPKDNTPG